MIEQVSIVDAITLVGVIYAGITVYLIHKTNKDNHEWNRRIASQNAIKDINIYSGDIITELNKIFNTHSSKESIPLKTILAEIDKDGDIQIKINYILNSYEALSRGVHHLIYDEEIIKVARRGIMINQYNLYHNYIEQRREVSNKKAYSELEALINKWKLEDGNNSYREKTG